MPPTLRRRDDALAPVAARAPRSSHPLLDLFQPRTPSTVPRTPKDALQRANPPLARAAPLPTRTTSPLGGLAVLATRVQPRQAVHTTSTIPSAYAPQNPSQDTGTVVGITLGAVGGFILILWLLYSFMSLGNRGPREESSTVSVGPASIVSRPSRRRHHRSQRRRETVEVRSRSRGPPVVVVEGGPSRGETVVVEERRRSVSRPAAPMPPRVVVSDDDDDDEVVVIEEHSQPRRQSSRRRSDDARRDSGYRDVRSDRYGGGDTPMREVRRSTGSRRR